MLRFVATAAVAIIAVVISGGFANPPSTLAHEHRAVGNYEFVVGWLNEPALAYEPNGLSLRITFFPNGVPEEESEEAEAAGQPMVGLEETLEAEIIAGGGAATRALPLEPAFGEEGAYESVIIPTAAGDYTFRIFGEIDGQQVDERFSSGPETFDSIEEVKELQFPEELAPPSTQDGASASAPESSSDDTARILGIIGIIVGIIGLAAAGLAVAAQRRA